MKASEARELPSEELRSRLSETKEELFNLRFQQATGQLENYMRLGMLKRDVARMLTILHEREAGIVAEPDETEARSRRPARAKARAEAAARSDEPEEMPDEEGED